MAPFNSHYEAATAYSLATQDGFDARLNQTVFAAAFGLGGILFLGVLAYLTYWIVGHCKVRRRLEGDAFKVGPKALLLPGRAASTGRSRPSPPPYDGKESEEKLGECERDRRRFWFSKMRANRTKCKDESVSEKSQKDLAPPSLPPRARLHPRKARTAEFPEKGFDPALSLLVAGPSPPRQASQTNCAGDSDAVPRIMVEDVDPDADSNPFTCERMSSSDAGSDMSLDEKEQSDEFLAVPPMSWNAPRDPLEDTDEEEAGLGVQETHLALRRMKPEAKSKMMSALADLSNMARFRPRLSRRFLNRSRTVNDPSSR